jgi:hypothetical protein
VQSLCFARSRRLSYGRRWLFAFAAAIWLAQLLATMHGVVHLPQLANAAADSHAAHSHANDGQVHEDHAATAWLAALFSVHDDQTDCRLYDQAGHEAMPLQVTDLTLPAVLTARIVHIPRGEALARWAALFQARAPPVS